MLLGFNTIWVCGLVRGNVILWVCAEVGFLGGCVCWRYLFGFDVDLVWGVLCWWFGLVWLMVYVGG